MKLNKTSTLKGNIINSTVKHMTSIIKNSKFNKFYYEISTMQPEMIPILLKYLKDTRNINIDNYNKININTFEIDKEYYGIPYNEELLFARNKCLYILTYIADFEIKKEILSLKIIGENAKLEFNKIRNDIKTQFRNKNKGKVAICNIALSENGYVLSNSSGTVKPFLEIYSDKTDEIIKDLDNFSKDEGFYKENNLRYKIGILLYGKAGTGKSTIAEACAKHLDKTLAYIDPKGITYDNLSQLKGVLSNKVVIFEEIDTCYSNRNNNNWNTKNNDLGAILQLLDSSNSPTGTVFIATTNHIKKLDEALLRRFDYKYEITDIDKPLAEKMVKHYRENPNVILKDCIFPINPNQLQQKIIEYRKLKNNENKRRR